MKEKCANHSDKTAVSFCHACGKHFCDSCLMQGKEFYYCYNQNCQESKIRAENIVSKDIKENVPLLSTNAKGSFFKHTLLFLSISFPIYLFASAIIADIRLKTWGILSLLAFFACGQSLIANSLLGYGLHKVSVKVGDKIKEARQNSLIISAICFVVFTINLEKIKGFDSADNATAILSFGVSTITLLIFNIVSFVLIKRHGTKSI